MNGTGLNRAFLRIVPEVAATAIEYLNKREEITADTTTAAVSWLSEKGTVHIVSTEDSRIAYLCWYRRIDHLNEGR